MTPEFFHLYVCYYINFTYFWISVAFTLAGSALIFAFLGDLPKFLTLECYSFPQRIYGIMINEALVAVPLFIFMGVLLEKTKLHLDY